MAAKIFLAESTVVTWNTNTEVYDCPDSKAARIRMLWTIEGGTSTSQVFIEINPVVDDRIIQRLYTGGHDCISSIASGSGDILSNTVGIYDGSAIYDADGGTGEQLVVPFPHDYYLNADDRVKFGLGGSDALQVLVQVMGVEDDV